MKGTVEARQRAADLLAEEIARCVCDRLDRYWKPVRAPWEHVPWYTSGWHCAWDVANGAAKMYVFAGPDGAWLRVHGINRMFSHEFKLHKTDSPRKVVCLLVEWLKQAQVRAVMLG